MKKQFKKIIKSSILEDNLYKITRETFDNIPLKDYFYDKYNLNIKFNSNEFLNENKEQIINKVRIKINNMIEGIESRSFRLEKIKAEGIPKDNNDIEIILTREREWEHEKPRKKALKVYLNFSLPAKKINIERIIDTIDYNESGIYIDERNRNKEFYNNLLLKKYKNERISIESLTQKEWLQLILKEKVTNEDLEKLYEIPISEEKKYRKKYIPSIKKYADEYVFYFHILMEIPEEVECGNFCIIDLEYAKKNGIEIIYEYENNEYHELFNVDEEIKKQKEIEENNLKGQKYEIPLTGIILKKMYEAIINNKLDKKILKSDSFLMIYGENFLKSRAKHIKPLIDLYEEGDIYKLSSFTSYQKLYKMAKLELTKENNLTLTNDGKLVNHVPKSKEKQPIKPKNYIEINNIKIKNGDKAQDIIYKYECEKLKDFPKLVKKIEKKYLTDEGCGYDIKSYDLNGNEIHIEVKSFKIKSDKKIVFNISANEDKELMENKNAYIYYLFNNFSSLRIITHEQYIKFAKKITGYKIEQDIIEE